MGRKIKSNLEVTHPELIREWNFSRNSELPSMVSKGMTKKVWWICDKGHEWEARIGNRANGTGCPYCSGRLATEKNSFGTLFPELLKLWNTPKNDGISPYMIKPFSNKKFWWRCKNGHEYITRVCHITMSNSSNCPYCAGKKVTKENSLAVKNTKLAEQWHPEKNGVLTPNDITSSSSMEVWWMCDKGHEWKISINSRSSANSGCPFCSGRRVYKDNCLEVLNPLLAKQWHSIRNGSLTPRDITLKSGLKVWWICEKGHEWNTRVADRAQGKGCPICSNKKVSQENCLATVNPILARQWNSAKNAITPQEVVSGSSKKVWWKCDRGHEWLASIAKRSRGTGCPQCNIQTSFPEQACFFYLKKVFRSAENRFKLDNLEVDIYIPELNLAIEYDGYPFHHKEEVVMRDKKKDFILSRNRIQLIRIRADGLPILYSPKTVYFKHNIGDAVSLDSLRNCIVDILNYISAHYKLPQITKMLILSLNDLDIKNDYNAILDQYAYSTHMMSIVETDQLLWEQWHPTRNRSIRPENISRGSTRRIWWMCDKGHEWFVSSNSRTRKHYISGCPYCSGKISSKEYSLEKSRPDLVKEWHIEKNDGLTPSDVTPGSGKKVWWRCKNNHEWIASVDSRNRRNTGCPYCNGRRKA